MNRIHKCKIVDILTEAQYIEIYTRMRNTQIETYDKYMEKEKMVLTLRTREKKQIINITARGCMPNTRHNIMILDCLYQNFYLCSLIYNVCYQIFL